ncbi:CDP-alcohol phosphatidyltransferase family protein [Latilactobacillus curvatus]|nr:CDP-alcohol phosphatidyltransferase family protein [Latilactobacillus curvatus]
MTPEKKVNAKKDLFAFYIGRPLSYVLTIPFLWLKIQPNIVSIIASIEIIIAGAILASSYSIQMALVGWFLFFLWNLLDGVDGNIARLRKNGSKIGSVYDAMSGYEAMFLLYFCAGIYAFHLSHNVDYLQIIIGAISGVSVIFPRLIMHKANTELGTGDESKLTNKKSFGIFKTIALNITSISGFVQIFLLLAIISNTVKLFNNLYLLINVAIMLVSIRNVLKGE